MPDQVAQIKSMKLYTHIERVYNELDLLGKDADSPLNTTELSAFDQLHYHGTRAVDYAIDLIDIRPGMQVLEIGSGFGGPARHIAGRTQACVTALELQPDQHELAADLTGRCGLGKVVNHLCGDFLTCQWNGQQFDVIVSWLALFHIPDRQKLLDIAGRILKPEGLFFAEDMYCRNDMTTREREELSTGMYAAYLPDLATYQADFHRAGFEFLACDDMSDDWTDFTGDRLRDYRNARERHVNLHGESTFNALEEFYALVNRHFRSGKLGGLRFLARRR